MPIEGSLRRQRNSDTLRNVTIQMEESLLDWIEELSREQGLSRSAIISQVVRAGRDRARDTCGSSLAIEPTELVSTGTDS